MTFDIAIIGGGPAGYNAAEKAAANGFNTILFEKNNIGGVCLNEGCIPTKTLLYSAKLLDNAKSAAKYGINIEGQPGFDLEKIINRKDKTVKKLTGGVNMKLKANGVTIIQGEAIMIGEENGLINISCGQESYISTFVLVCTGSDTIIPPIKGLTETNFWTSKEALESKVLPKSLLIIGGGVIGMEFASFFNSMGVKVTVVEMMPEILGAMDKETSKMLRNEYSKRGVEFHLETKVVEIEANIVNSGKISAEVNGITPNESLVKESGNTVKVHLEKNSKIFFFETEKILLSVGRRAVTDHVGLENLNIEFSKNGVKVNEFMQTNHPRVYASGDITGFSMLAHTAIREGEVAINHITGIDDRMSYKAIPGVVYTNPEIAGVGKTEEELIASGTEYHVLKLPMAYSGRFVAENETSNGLCKLITDKDEKIIGCHMLGNPASELIVVAGIAIEKGFTVEDFKKIVFPHPTVGEILHESLNI